MGEEVHLNRYHDQSKILNRNPWMTVRPQHHRRPPSRPRRHWRHLLYNLPHLISLLSLLFRPRHRKTNHSATRSAECRRPSVLCTVSIDSSSTFFDVSLSFSISPPTSLIRIRGSNSNTRRAPQLSHQSALRSPTFQCSLPSSSSPCRCSHSPFTCYANHYDTA